MKTLSYALLTLIGFILLYYLWPVFIGFVLIVAAFLWYLSYRAKKSYRDNYDNAEDKTFYRQSPHRSSDIIEAEYREKEIE